jgi:hypothetical protein
MGQKNLSGDPNFDFLVNWNDSTLKLTSVQCINRYTNRNVTVRVDPVDPVTGVEDTSREIVQTYAPGANVTNSFPQTGANSITLTFNAKGGISGYDDYIDVGPVIG